MHYIDVLSNRKDKNFCHDRFILSAKNSTLDVRFSERLLMQIRNKTGLRIQPLGTPEVVGNKERWSSRMTLKSLLPWR